jgi:hypothetical protein
MIQQVSSYKILTPRVTTLVVYGTIWVKSVAITVNSWPSMLNFWTASEPALMIRILWFFPGLNLNVGTPAFDLQGVPSVINEQSKLFCPLMRLLSESGMMAENYKGQHYTQD